MASNTLAISASTGTLDAIQRYWEEHIHDLAIVTEPIGTPGFFQELETYRYEKLAYLPKLVDFTAYRGKKLLEVGCGVGIDLVHFAQAGASVTGIDLAKTSVDLANMNFEQRDLSGNFIVMNGEDLQFADDTFDVVYAHGVVQYTAQPEKMIGEIFRVLKPTGEAILMVYNKFSWLNALSKFMNVGLEHADAPAFRTFSTAELKALLEIFPRFRVVPERFPVETRLHHGLKATLFNGIFVRAFRTLPRSLVRPLGWHLIAFCFK